MKYFATVPLILRIFMHDATRPLSIHPAVNQTGNLFPRLDFALPTD